MDTRLPPAEVHVEADLVERLLSAQHPKFLCGDIALVDEGWDNFTYRVGPDFAVRLPRREAAVELLLNEQKWLPVIAGWISPQVPAPVAVGVPGTLFGWPWSVVPWIAGCTAEGLVLSSSDAALLAVTLRALHREGPLDAPTKPFRGVPLQQRREVVDERLERLGLTELAAPWCQALDTPPASSAVWLHGDLQPRNVLVHDGALSGLIDWGDMTVGDAATDLACAWMLVDDSGRSEFLDAYAATEAERARSVGWAVNFGSAMLDSGDPRHVAIGNAIVRCVSSAW